MFKFIQDAMTELEHVVWPTPNETKKYMYYTVGVIIVLATALAILGYAIRGSLSAIRGQFPHTAPTTVSGEDNLATQADLDSLKESIAKRKATHSSGSGTMTGTTIMIQSGTITSTGNAQ